MKKLFLIFVTLFSLVLINSKSFSMSPNEAKDIVVAYFKVYEESSHLLTRSIKRLKHSKKKIREAIQLLLPSTEGSLCEAMRISYIELAAFVIGEDFEFWSSKELLKLTFGEAEKAAEDVLNKWPDKRLKLEEKILVDMENLLEEIPKCN